MDVTAVWTGRAHGHDCQCLIGVLESWTACFCCRDPKEVVRPRIPLMSGLEVFGAEETVLDFYSSAIKAKSTAQK